LVVPVPETSSLNLNDAAPATNTLVATRNSTGSSETFGPGGNGTRTGAGPGVPGANPDSERVIHITPEVREPVLIRKVQPVYPRLAINAHWEGIVILEAVISKTGTVESARVLSSPQSVFSDAAVAAVEQWLYKPAMMNGRPISVYFTVTVKFQIK
jgi:protein TonB